MRSPRFLVVPALALAALALAAGPVSAASWRPVVTLASSGRLGSSGSVAVSGNTVHVLYTRAGVVTYRRSIDGGRTFGSPVGLITSTDLNHFTAIAIAAYGDRVAALYSKVQTGHPPPFLFVKISENGGRTWSVPMFALGTSNPTRGAVAVSANGFWVAGDGRGEVYVAHATTSLPTSCGVNCLKWQKWTSQPVGRTTNRAVQNDPNTLDPNVALVAWGNRVNVFWAPDGIAEGTVGHIVQRRSTDGGANWKPEETVASDAAVVVGARPAAVSAFSTNILLAYQRRDGHGVVLRSANAGRSWSTVTATPPPTSGGSPIIEDVALGYRGAARLVYGSFNGMATGDQLWVRTSSDGGEHWSSPSRAVGPQPSFKGSANIVGAGMSSVLVFGSFAAGIGPVSVYARVFN